MFYCDRTEDQGQSNEAAQKSALRYFNDCLAEIMPDDMPVKTWPDFLKVDGIDPFVKLLVKDISKDIQSKYSKTFARSSDLCQIVSNGQRICPKVGGTGKCLGIL